MEALLNKLVVSQQIFTTEPIEGLGTLSLSSSSSSKPPSNSPPHQQPSQSGSSLPSRGASLSSTMTPYTQHPPQQSNNMARSSSHDQLTLTQQQHVQQQYGRREGYSSSQSQSYQSPSTTQALYHQPVRVGHPQHHLSSGSLSVAPGHAHVTPASNSFYVVNSSPNQNQNQSYVDVSPPSSLHQPKVYRQHGNHANPVNGFHQQNAKTSSRSGSRPLTVYHPSSNSSSSILSLASANNLNVVHPSYHQIAQHVQAAPEIPSGPSASTDSVQQHQQLLHQQIAQQQAFTRTSPTSSSALPGYTQTSHGNNNGSRSSSGLQLAPQTSSSLNHPTSLVTTPASTTGKRVRALYNCVGENPAELSFEPNAIIYDGEYEEFTLIP